MVWELKAYESSALMSLHGCFLSIHRMLPHNRQSVATSPHSLMARSRSLGSRCSPWDLQHREHNTVLSLRVTVLQSSIEPPRSTLTGAVYETSYGFVRSPKKLGNRMCTVELEWVRWGNREWIFMISPFKVNLVEFVVRFSWTQHESKQPNERDTVSNAQLHMYVVRKSFMSWFYHGHVFHSRILWKEGTSRFSKS